MGNPASYDPAYNFSGFQEYKPDKSLPGDAVDNELENISTAVNDHKRRIEDIRRSDGMVQNGIVTLDSMAPDARHAIDTVATRAEDAAAAAQAARDEVVNPVAPVFLETTGAAGYGPYSMGTNIGSKAGILVSVNGVGTRDFTISGTTFTLSNALPAITSADTITAAMFVGRSIGVPTENTVGVQQLDPEQIPFKVTTNYPRTLAVFGVDDAPGADPQDSAIGAMVTQIPGVNVDMANSRVNVDAWQTGARFQRGEQVIKEVGIPVEDTFRMRSRRLTNTNTNCHWVQDKAFIGPRGQICVLYWDGTAHHSEDNKLVQIESGDGGSSYSAPEFLIRAEASAETTVVGNTDNYSVMSAGLSPNQREILFVQKINASDETYELWDRLLPNHRKVNAGCTLETTNTQSKLRLNWPKHGYRVGEALTFQDLIPNGGADLASGGALNGVTLASGDVTVTAATETYIEFATATPANATQTGIPVTLIARNLVGAFTRTDVTTALEDAYTLAYGALPANGLNYQHSFATDGTSIVVGMQTNDGASLIKFDSIYTIGPVVIPLGFKGGEPTVVYAGSGRWCGFVRGDDYLGSTGRSKFWWSTDNLATFDYDDVRPSNLMGGQTWNEITPLTICNGWVLAARCERTDDPTATVQTRAASLLVYLLKARVDDVFALGAAAFKISIAGRIRWTGAKTNQGGPNAGTGSWVTYTPPLDAVNTAMSELAPNYERAFYIFSGEVETYRGDNDSWSFGQIFALEFEDIEAPGYGILEGGGATSIAPRIETIRNPFSSQLNTHWTAAVGTYQTDPPPTTPVDQTNSVDYKRGGVLYVKDGIGMVHMFGRINADGSAVNPAFRLPAGLWPASDITVMTPAGAAKQNDRSAGTHVFVTIFGANSTNVADRGQVYIDREAAVGLGGAINNISLDGISWLADGAAL